MKISTGAGAGGVLALLLMGGCAKRLSYDRMEPPEGPRAFGVTFGGPRDEAERALFDAGVSTRPAPDDEDALVATRCPGAPVIAPCRLVFGPQGLYAAQIDAPPSEASDLVGSVEKALGPPARRAGPAGVTIGVPPVIAAWDRAGWTIAVSHVAADGPRAAAAVLRVEWDAAAPPVVAGVPLGRRRGRVEAALDQQGAILVSRDSDATTYLGCPQGAPDAISCVVLFRGDRAAAVTELHPSPPEDRPALESWQLRAARFEKDVGRAPAVACPHSGPDRVQGDCVATWATQRLVVAVGAHRNAGGKHRGAISIYTSWSYPPLAAGGDAAAEGASP